MTTIHYLKTQVIENTHQTYTIHTIANAIKDAGKTVLSTGFPLMFALGGVKRLTHWPDRALKSQWWTFTSLLPPVIC